MKRIACVLAMALTCVMTHAFPAQCAAGSREIPTAPFDAGLYALGYEVFLANSNPADAFAVAEKAVAALPNDPEWRRRAARSGEWSGNPARALEHWFFLATSLSDPGARIEALRLARMLRDFRKLKNLLQPSLADGGEDILREYVAACESLGLPGEAIAVLESRRGGKAGKYALEQLARLHEESGRPEDALTALLELAAGHNGITAPLLLRAASLAYGKGDVLSAYTILNLGKMSIPPGEHEYWAQVSDLDWAVQDIMGAVRASRILIEQGKGREADYQRLIFANRDGDPDETYRVALHGWRLLKKPSLGISLLEAGTALNRHGELLTLFTDPSVPCWKRGRH